MSEIRHTPAPWGKEYCGKDTIKIFKTSDKRRVATIKVKYRGMDEANAERIVACVNACAGIDPESVPELMEACKMAVETFRDFKAGLDLLGHTTIGKACQLAADATQEVINRATKEK